MSQTSDFAATWRCHGRVNGNTHFLTHLSILRTSSVVDFVEMVDIENAGFNLMVSVLLMQLVCSIAET